MSHTVCISSLLTQACTSYQYCLVALRFLVLFLMDIWLYELLFDSDDYLGCFLLTWAVECVYVSMDLPMICAPRQKFP